MNELPIDLSFEHNSSQSNWRNNRNKQYYWLFSFNGLHNRTDVGFILSFWDYYDSNDREIFEPLLKSLMKLEKSVDIDPVLTRELIRENMYTMF